MRVSANMDQYEVGSEFHDNKQQKNSFTKTGCREARMTAVKVQKPQKILNGHSIFAECLLMNMILDVEIWEVNVIFCRCDLDLTGWNSRGRHNRSQSA